MKTITLALMRLKDDFIHKKFIMSLFLIGSVISTLVFMYFFSGVPVVFRQYMNYLNDPSSRTFKISFNEAHAILPDDFSALQYYGLSGTGATIREDSKGSTVSSVAVSDPSFLCSLGALDYDAAVEFFHKKSAFIVSDKSSLISTDNIELYGHKFNCSGLYTDCGSTFFPCIISLESVYQYELPVSEIIITLDHVPDRAAVTSIKSELASSFGKYSILGIVEPSNSNQDEQNKLAYQIFISVIAYAVCFLGCAYLFKYVFDINTYENTIFSLVGAPKARVILMVLIECAMLSLISNFAAIMIHYYLFDALFKNIDMVVYSLEDYAFVGVFTFLLSIITTVPFFIKYTKEPIMKTKIEL